MSILFLPNELLLLIASHLERRDMNALLQTHSSLYHVLVGCLYQGNVTDHGPSAVAWAAKVGSIGTLERFLGAGVDLHWKSWYRARMSRILPRSRQYRIRSIMVDTKRDHPICYAAANGHGEFVRKLIEKDVDINFKDADGRSPLALAARHGHFALVQMLISLGANQLAYDRFHQRPVSSAASQGHHIIADYLLQELANYSAMKLDHTIKVDIQWMLLYAAKEGSEKRVRAFLSKGADINFRPKGERCTPLCGALFSAPRPLRIVKFLLARGADPNISAPHQEKRPAWKLPPNTPLRLAMLREESLDLTKVLLKSGADARQFSLALFEAVTLKKAAELRLLLAHNADIHVRLRGKSLAKLTLESDCQSIRELGLEWDIDAPTRELALRRVRGNPGGGSRRLRRRRGQTAPDETVSAESNRAL